MDIPLPFHANRPGLVRPVRVDDSGLLGPTRRQARGNRWRTTSRGLFVPSEVELSVEQRIVEAAAVLRDGEAVTGWAALRWLGAEWFGGATATGAPLDVPLVSRRHVLAQDGFSISQEFVHPAQVLEVDGLPVTTPSRSVVFEMRHAAGLGDAVIALDMACYADLVSLNEVAVFVAQLGPVTGIQQARDGIAESDENAWSPMEVSMRRVWTRVAGLPRPLCNAPVFTLDGHHLGTADLIDPEVGIAGEYNGALHLLGSQMATDLRRESAFREAGLETVTMVAANWGDIDEFARRLRRAYLRARDSGRPKRWTLDPPDWWVPTRTVEQRRSLDEGQRDRFLRYRRAA